jgi:hypothetical protein
MMAAPITVTRSTLEVGAPLVLFPTRFTAAATTRNKGGQYDVALDTRFLIKY